MAPKKSMKKAGVAAPIKSRCNVVKNAVQHAGECPDRVKKMLCNSLFFTVGTPKADRHPFNERFVAMIEQVMEAEQARLNNAVASKEAAFAELSPAKAGREAALEQAKVVAAQKGEESGAAKQAATDAGAAVKEAAAAVKQAIAAQKSGDEGVEGLAAKKALLEGAVNDDLAPLVAGTAADEKSKKIKNVLSTGKQFGFDTSLLGTAEQVLERDAAERGGFDTTCLEQLQAAFASAIAGLTAEIEAGAPAKAERAAAVEQAEGAKAAAEASAADLKEKAAAAKTAKADADAAEKAAAKSLSDFMPELKEQGDGLDNAKKAVEKFAAGPRHTFTELKDHVEGQFKPKKAYYEKIDGLSCDRAVIDACREAVAGAGDNRVSAEDAKKVFDKLADGNKITHAEQWTLRYCLQEFKWTEAAHDWIVEEIKKVPQQGGKKRAGGKSYYETIDGYKCDRGIIDACRELVAGQGDGRVSAEDAQKVWEKAADGNKVTNAEKWTLRYCFSTFNWTRAGHDYVLEQLNQLQKDGTVAVAAAA